MAEGDDADRVGQPLAVHVLLHEGSAAGTSSAAYFAGRLHSRLTRGAGASGIPVGIWAAAGAGDEARLPPLPDLTTAARNAVVVLVDQDFFDARRTWTPYVEDLAARLREGSDLLLPVTVLGDAHLVSPALRDVNHVPVPWSDGAAWDEGVFNAVLTALVRLLPDVGEPAGGGASPPRAFLCHAKSDGHGIASEIRRHIYERTQLTCFFDANDIPHGEGVRRTIEASIARSCLLVVWTDRLLESRWCQYEIMEARRQGRPLVVLDALTAGSPRVFPFLGNMPVVRWDGDPERVLGAMLMELLRSRHVRALFDALGGAATEATDFVPHPPDLVEAGRRAPAGVAERSRPADARVTVYPDPPLGTEELSFLGDLFADRRLCSLSEWVALRAAGALGEALRGPSSRVTPFSGLSVGLSLSETEAWRSLGMTSGHLDDISVETARQLILLGSRLVWGSDLRPGGIGGRLGALVRTYHQSDHAPQDHVACYLAWPTHRAASGLDLAERRTFAEVRCLPCPIHDEPPSGALDAVCYSLMRREVAAACHARVVLGGKLDRFGGRYPGVLEEAAETVALGRPLYVLGGFGGAAAAVYEAIASPEAPTLRRAWEEHCGRPGVSDAQVAYDELRLAMGNGLRVEHDEVLRLLSDVGPRGLSASNGLSPSENERLARSRDLSEVLALVVRGLARSRAPGDAPAAARA